MKHKTLHDEPSLIERIKELSADLVSVNNIQDSLRAALEATKEKIKLFDEQAEQVKGLTASLAVSEQNFKDSEEELNAVEARETELREKCSQYRIRLNALDYLGSVIIELTSQ